MPTQHICLGKKLTSSVCKEWKVAADVGNNKTWVADADNNNNTKQLLIDQLEPFTEYKVAVTSFLSISLDQISQGGGSQPHGRAEHLEGGGGGWQDLSSATGHLVYGA